MICMVVWELYSSATLANPWITPRSLLFGVLAHLYHWHPLSQFFLSAMIIVYLEVISSQQYIYALNFSTQCLISGCLQEVQCMVQALFHGKDWEVSTICIRILPTSVFYSEIWHQIHTSCFYCLMETSPTFGIIYYSDENKIKWPWRFILWL